MTNYKYFLEAQGFTCAISCTLYECKFTAVGPVGVGCCIDPILLKYMIRGIKDAENQIWKQLWLKVAKELK